MFERFTLITGPCVLENDELNLEIAHAVKRLSETFALPVIFKASFDKANRSRMDSARGPGLADGLQRLATLKEETGLPLLTDIHEPQQAERVAPIVDVLQIPAFLCRQTDLLLAAGATGKPVNVKKGQWMSPDDMAGAVEKLRLIFNWKRRSRFCVGVGVYDLRRKNTKPPTNSVAPTIHFQRSSTPHTNKPTPAIMASRASIGRPKTSATVSVSLSSFVPIDTP